MSITDPIADMATLLRNASRAHKEKVDVRASKINEEILKLLKREKFIQDYKRIPERGQVSLSTGTGFVISHSVGKKPVPDKRRDLSQPMLRIYIKYDNHKPSISNIKRISKPGLRVYRKKDSIVPVLGGLGVAIVSTPAGILTDKEAREKNLGGEVLLEVW